MRRHPASHLGENFRELVPASMMMINQKLGGVVVGVFDEDGGLLAFLLGQTGLREGTRELLHWSHMMAVRSHVRGLGLGRHLKLYQRRFLLDLGIDEAEWTYDPLESRNAHLNLNRLGALPFEYRRNVYGDGSTSGLHSGIGTDRFVTRWKLRDPNVEAKIEGRYEDHQGHDAQWSTPMPAARRSSPRSTCPTCRRSGSRSRPTFRRPRPRTWTSPSAGVPRRATLSKPTSSEVTLYPAWTTTTPHEGPSTSF